MALTYASVHVQLEDALDVLRPWQAAEVARAAMHIARSRRNIPGEGAFHPVQLTTARICLSPRLPFCTEHSWCTSTRTLKG